MIKVWYDGACGPTNPGGHTGCGVSIRENDRIIYQESHYLGFGQGMSNNVAEYLGIIRALTYLIENNRTEDTILCYGDSKLTIMQMTGQWKSKKGSYRPYYLQAIYLSKNFKDISFHWIRRHLNDDADELSKVAINTQTTYKYEPQYKMAVSSGLNLPRRRTTLQADKKNAKDRTGQHEGWVARAEWKGDSPEG